MHWREALEPAAMCRVALVAPVSSLRRVLVEVADQGSVEFEPAEHSAPAAAREALERARRARGDGASAEPAPRLLLAAPEVGELERLGRIEELAGEAALEDLLDAATRREEVAALLGWIPATSVQALAARVAPFGGAVVVLRLPPGEAPPTLITADRATRTFQPLVDTYATVPYADLNPSLAAGILYVLMFGMMFGDVGHGLLLAVAGVVLAKRPPRSLARLSHLAPFVIGAGIAAIGFGLAYGEAFGPTHLVPTLWLDPLSDPTFLLDVAIGTGAVLLAGAYVLGSANRWREGGFLHALVATQGLAGTGLYLGVAALGLGLYRHALAPAVAGGTVAALGLGLIAVGSYPSGSGTSGLAEAGVGLFDAVVRIATNTVSFARLAAFGLTHAALTGVVWSGTAGLWHRGPAFYVLAGVLFVLGNAVAIGLEGLVVGVQALRLEYYELFSRVFTGEGRRFVPWHVPTSDASLSLEKEVPCSLG